MWTLPQAVRDEMGIGAKEILDDRQIEEKIRKAQEQIKEELFDHHYNEVINNNPATNATWDGTNKTFQTQKYPIMDSNYDNTVNSDDVTARWLDTDYNYSVASVTVSNATFGVLRITQTNDAAIPANAENVVVEYYSCHREISKLHLENLTIFLAAHSVLNTLKAGTSISLNDLMKNEKIILQNPNVFLRKYTQLLEQLRGTTIRGV